MKTTLSDSDLQSVAYCDVPVLRQIHRSVPPLTAGNVVSLVLSRLDDGNDVLPDYLAGRLQSPLNAMVRLVYCIA